MNKQKVIGFAFDFEGPIVEFDTQGHHPAHLVCAKKVGLDLTVRTRRAGDYISPFGMKGSMKMKKYLNSKGVLQHEKNQLIMLCQGSEVLWVAGVGLSNKLRVENKPTHVIELRNKN